MLGGPQFSLADRGERVTVNLMKEKAKEIPPKKLAIGEREKSYLQADKDSGSEASQQGSEAEREQHEKRRLVGQVVR